MPAPADDIGMSFALSCGWAGACNPEAHEQAALRDTADRAEGVKAFLENRKAGFAGEQS